MLAGSRAVKEFAHPTPPGLTSPATIHIATNHIVTYDKRILTFAWGNNEARDEYTNSNGFVISPNLYRHDIAYLVELAEEAKRDFPGLNDTDIEVFRVTKSRYNQGFWGVKFPLPENTVKKGYRIVSELDFSHC